MNKKVCIITGASSGIGFETAKALAAHDFCVVLACRNDAKAQDAKQQIVQQTQNNDVFTINLDLSSFDSINRFTKEFCNQFDSLEILINNAGTFCDRPYKTDEGFELAMGVNYIGAYYLTYSLLPLIKKTPKARIINVSSSVGYHKRKMPDVWDFYNVRHGFKSYTMSKYAQILYTIDLAKQLKDDDVTVNVLHPGIVATSIMVGDSKFSILIEKIMKFVFMSAQDGAKTTIYLAVSPDVANTTGMMFSKSKEIEYKNSALNARARQSLIQTTDDVINEAKQCKKNTAI